MDELSEIDFSKRVVLRNPLVNLGDGCYPCLKRRGNTIVWFIENDVGTCLWSDDFYLIGRHGYWNEDAYVPFEGEVRIIQEGGLCPD